MAGVESRADGDEVSSPDSQDESRNLLRGRVIRAAVSTHRGCSPPPVLAAGCVFTAIDPWAYFGFFFQSAARENSADLLCDNKPTRWPLRKINTLKCPGGKNRPVYELRSGPYCFPVAADQDKLS